MIDRLVRPRRTHACGDLFFYGSQNILLNIVFRDETESSIVTMASPITKSILSFRRHLKREKKHGNTIQSYSRDVSLFMAWMTETVGAGFVVADITQADIKDYKSYLLTRHVSPTSINRKLTALRQFFEFCLSQQLAPRNPVMEVAPIPVAVQMPSILTRKEQLLLLRTVEKSLRPLDSSVLLLLLHAGLRSSEICALTIGDLHLTPRKAKLFIRSDQGRKLRFVNLTSRTQAALRMYCKRRGISILSRLRREEMLFRQQSGTPLTQQYIDHIVKKIGKQAGLSYVTPTMLRNTYAIQVLLNGEPPAKVGRTLGIGSIRSLQRIAEMMKRQEHPDGNH